MRQSMRGCSCRDAYANTKPDVCMRLDTADGVRLQDQPYDALVIGTGVGGATLGYALARHGWRVLFCEKGTSRLSGHQTAGDYAECVDGLDSPSGTRAHALLRGGRSPETIEDWSARG